MGPTGCGKTVLVFKILLSDSVSFPVPTRIRYHYGVWQNRFAEVEATDPRFEFVEGLPVFDDLPDWGQAHSYGHQRFDGGGEQFKDSNGYFYKTQSSQEHDSVILGPKVINGRTHNTRFISQNAHLMILFKNPRDADTGTSDVPKKPYISFRRNKETLQLLCGELSSRDG